MESISAGPATCPCRVLLHAAAARLTGEYLLSGKVIDIAAMALLLGVLYVILVRRGASRWLGATLVAGVLVTEVGLIAAFGIRHEAIPTVLQLAAVALIAWRRPSLRTVAIAAVLCVLALFAKFSAVYAVLTILVLLRKDRASVATFIAVGLVGLAAGLTIMHVLTGGRFADTLLQSSVGDYSVESFIRAPARLVWLLRYAPAALLLLAFTLIVQIQARRPSVGPYEVALVMAGLTTTIILLDRGASGNHLLDLAVLIPIVALDAVRPRDGTRPRRTTNAAAQALPFVATLGVLIGGAVYVADAIPTAVRQLRTGVVEPRYDAHPLAPGSVADTLLSEDPYLPVSLERRPIVLDPFMLSQLGELHPEWIQSLAERIERQEFTRVVLLMDINDPDADAFYTDNHLGPGVLSAMRERYRLVTTIPATGTWVGTYFVYEPNGQESP